MITVERATLSEIVQVNAKIPEFEPYDEKYFSERYAGKEHLDIIAKIDGQPAGYMIAYDRFDDGSLYCWMAAAVPEHRRKGVLSALMNYQYEWAKENGYDKIKIKTRNNRRDMIVFLAKRGYLFAEVIPMDNIKENRILLEKDLRTLG